MSAKVMQTLMLIPVAAQRRGQGPAALPCALDLVLGVPRRIPCQLSEGSIIPGFDSPTVTVRSLQTSIFPPRPEDYGNPSAAFRTWVLCACFGTLLRTVLGAELEVSFLMHPPPTCVNANSMAV